uniref:Uncharacterized protein n=1 Tax=Manihot esculenta TaxID=3983 RepID=A0A2C9U7B4_MANES
MKDSKIRVVIFGCSLSFFHFSRISGFTSHSSSSSSFIVMGIGAFPFTWEWVACLVATRKGTDGGAVASDRGAMADVMVSFSAVCFDADGISVVSV